MLRIPGEESPAKAVDGLTMPEIKSPDMQSSGGEAKATAGVQVRAGVHL